MRLALWIVLWTVAAYFVHSSDDHLTGSSENASNLSSETNLSAYRSLPVFGFISFLLLLINSVLLINTNINNNNNNNNNNDNNNNNNQITGRSGGIATEHRWISEEYWQTPRYFPVFSLLNFLLVLFNAGKSFQFNS
jgi:hypothetical protein